MGNSKTTGGQCHAEVSDLGQWAGRVGRFVAHLHESCDGLGQ
jgi:hypothetical protein